MPSEPDSGSHDRDADFYQEPRQGKQPEGKDAGDMAGEPKLTTTIQYRPGKLHVPSGRYVVKQFHARGGMGEVWLAEDFKIGREVALKTIRRGREGQGERFLVEAQITGQMEHPSIVPVHDVGEDDEGRPFYIMKFVRGRTFKDAIEEYHAADGPMPAASTQEPVSAAPPREVQRLRLLEIFVALCRGVAYAHSRGVIHRDLKPDNVMLGAFGEMLILDWGLARVLGEAEIASSGISSPCVRLTYPGASTETQDGSVIGALPYMAPEIAEGKAADADQRTDVYLLGATLYEVLTGRPPRSGSSRDELIELARTVPVTPPRQLNPQVPKPLSAICLRALKHRKQDRYQTALALAEDVERYLAGERVLAYREGMLARAWRWSKRHRKGLARGTLGAAAICLALVAASMLRTAERRRQEAVRQAAALAVREDARREVSQFRRLAEQVRFFAANADPAGEQAPYYDPAKGNALRREALALAGKWGPQLDRLPLAGERRAVKEDLYDLLLLQVQTSLPRANDTEAAGKLLAVLERASALQQPTRSLFRLRSSCWQIVGDDERSAQDAKRAADSRIPATALDHFLAGEASRTGTARLSGASAADVEVNRERLEQAIAEYRQALALDPEHFWAAFQLGRCYLSLGRHAEAVEALGTCVAIHPKSAWAYSSRGLVLALMKRFDEAERDLDRAVEIDATFAPARLNRGIANMLREKPEEALDDFQKVLRAPRGQRLVEAAYYRGQILLSRGQPQAALADFELLSAERPDFRPVHLLSAKAHLMLNQTAEALTDLDRHLAATGGFNPAGAQAYHDRGHLLRLLAAQLPPALGKQAHLLALAQLEKALENGVKTAELFDDLAAVREKLGRAREALAAYAEGLQLAPTHVKLLVKRGWLLAAFKQFEASAADFEAAVAAEPQHAEAHAGLGYVHACLNGFEAARQEAELALLHGATDYLVLHNIACIYAVLAEADAASAVRCQDMAIAILRRDIELWKSRGRGPDPIQLIRDETAFHASLRARPEFQELIQ